MWSWSYWLRSLTNLYVKKDSWGRRFDMTWEVQTQKSTEQEINSATAAAREFVSAYPSRLSEIIVMDGKSQKLNIEWQERPLCNLCREISFRTCTLPSRARIGKCWSKTLNALNVTAEQNSRGPRIIQNHLQRVQKPWLAFQWFVPSPVT
jgi:hypothetical protein